MTALEGFVLGAALMCIAYITREAWRTRGARLDDVEADAAALSEMAAAHETGIDEAQARLDRIEAQQHSLDRDLEQIYARTPGITRYGKGHKA